MNIKQKITSAELALDEVLVECVDALIHTCWDDNIGNYHIEILSQTIRNMDINTKLYKLLNSAISETQKGRRHPFECSSGQQLAKQLESWMDANGYSRYVYHGTAFSNLRNIRNEGLRHDLDSNWEEEYVSAEHCNSAVFFDTSWRSALGWAEQACLKSDEDSPIPVAIRIPIKDLDLQKDTQATSNGAMMVKGSIKPENYCAIIGRDTGFPNWRPLDEILSES
ncbi:hypothetical protein [Maridesulfovibrio sp.]|uniref:hypothetical protein n=1 Tax=Maridesulfovibrio sp. TaxID=2795000 RepID=UPI0039F088B9